MCVGGGGGEEEDPLKTFPSTSSSRLFGVLFRVSNDGLADRCGIPWPSTLSTLSSSKWWPLRPNSLASLLARPE